MDLNFLIKGIIIGFSIAAPVGPIGILCIRRTIANGKASGLISGLGAATADGFYGTVAAYGLVGISNLLVGQQFWFRLIGGIFLLYLGIKIFTVKSGDKNSVTSRSKGLWGDYFSTFILTITNPVTILSFVAIFAGLGLGASANNHASAATMVVGVILGSILWWIILTEIVGFLKSRFNLQSTKIINKISGIIILIFAILAFASLIKT
ncbi:MAG: LysE family transporter [Candidatus Berkelbacteria bacterium]|nr:LysE family transporter [Candidatus Berkelbacteria bacterium]